MDVTYDKLVDNKAYIATQRGVNVEYHEKTGWWKTIRNILIMLLVGVILYFVIRLVLKFTVGI